MVGDTIFPKTRTYRNATDESAGETRDNSLSSTHIAQVGFGGGDILPACENSPHSVSGLLRKWSTFAEMGWKVGVGLGEVSSGRERCFREIRR